MSRAVLLLLVTVACVLSCMWLVEGCNELCGPIVSRCQLIKSCECDMTNKNNCTCCTNCQLCLSNQYTECCSCVGMCPVPDPEDSILKTSTIEALLDPIPELFNVLTEEEDYLKRWTTYRYPVYFDNLYTKHSNREMGKGKESSMGASMSDHDFASMNNCTVAFMSNCTSISKCKQSCKSMGSAKYRWFHNDGCCQCIGDKCVDYGLNEAKCLNCQSEEEDEVSEDGNHGNDGTNENVGNHGKDGHNGKEGHHGNKNHHGMKNHQGEIIDDEFLEVKKEDEELDKKHG